MTKPKDLRNLSEEELRSKKSLFYQELLKLNQQRYSGRLEKPHTIKELKKDIARINTILNEKSTNKK